MEQQNKIINYDEGLSLDLKSVFKEIGRRWIIIVLATVIAAALGFVISRCCITPTYRSDFAVYVNNKAASNADNNGQLTSQDVSASKSLANTYAAVFVSRTILEDSAENAGLPYSYGKVRGMVSTSISEDTQIVRVYVTTNSPEESYLLASSIAEVAKKEIETIVEGSSMHIVDQPYLPEFKHSPNNSKYLIFGALIGLLLSLVVIIWRFLADKRIRSVEYLEQNYKFPILASIPDLASKNNKNSYGRYGKYGN